MRDSLLRFMCLCLLSLLVTGCGDKQEKKTIRGLQEENRVQRDEIARLHARIEDLKAESRESEAAIVKRCKQKLADAESKLTSLRLELGAIQREKLVVDDLVESAPRVQMAKSARFVAERLIYLVLIGIALTFAGLFCLRWKRTNDRLQQLVMQDVSDLRRIGGPQ